MPGVAVDLSHGITIVFGTSGFTGELLDINWTGITRESVDTTHQGTAAPGANVTGNMTRIFSDVSDPGQVTFTVHAHTDGGATHVAPIDDSAETVTITLPATGTETATTFAGSGGVVDASLNMNFGEKLVWDVTLQWAGGVTSTPAA